ncbi:MAG: peptide chain release factor N(5)-glutamine methyltransferase [Actinomycetota bacterium]|nr:peptide chain release factor N(5)-glutamine methyltransferase [Actinomycetota bacterium]
MIEAAPDDDARLMELVQRRVAGEPLQYITGLAGFRHLELQIGPGALVPRPETESLAGRAIEVLPPNGTVIDIGTGAGPIALSIAHERPDARVVGTDISEEALEWARKNRDRLGLAVELIVCDLFEGVANRLRRNVDVIVSNPPYVSEAERSALPTEVVDHEPGVALFSPRDGLEVFERIAVSAKGWLRSGGVLLSEIGDRQADVVHRVLAHLGYSSPTIRPDLVGRPRIAEATWRP